MRECYDEKDKDDLVRKGVGLRLVFSWSLVCWIIPGQPGLRSTRTSSKNKQDLVIS
jgi:hypothetical protein